MRVRRTWIKALFCLALALFLLSGGALVRYLEVYRSGREEYEALVELALKETAGADGETKDGGSGDGKTGADIAPDSPEVDFEALKRINPQIFAWLYIPGTGISYPVVKGEDNETYLNRTFQGSQSIVGCLFADFRCQAPSPESNLIIYGHNMKNGSMFGSLRSYRSREFYETHPEIWLYFPDGSLYRCPVTGCFDIPSSYQSLPVLFEGEEKEHYLRSTEAARLYPVQASPSRESGLVTLVTCVAGHKEQRLAVQAEMKPAG